MENKTFVIGVSGGADSCSLALVLHELEVRKKLNHRYVIAHFDHGLRGEESRVDARWVSEFAEMLGFGSKTGEAADGEINARSNVEESARNARYRFLLEVSSKTKAHSLLLGHTKNDQAESVLLNLLRGSGLKGLSGMLPVIQMDPAKFSSANCSDEEKVKVVRPMLSWATREETEDFTRKKKVAFKADPMNDDLNLRRIRVRNELIPMLKTYNPGIVETLARTSQILAEESAELESFIEMTAKEMRCDKDVLKTKDLAALTNSRCKLIIRYWLSLKRGGLRRLETKHVENIVSLIHSRKSGRMVELPGGECVIKGRGELVFLQTKVEK
ncbi:MAG: tRNA lysidine(34) synthetase TilS [Pyrinomonadaceae bacterium]